MSVVGFVLGDRGFPFALRVFLGGSVTSITVGGLVVEPTATSWGATDFFLVDGFRVILVGSSTFPFASLSVSLDVTIPILSSLDFSWRFLFALLVLSGLIASCPWCGTSNDFVALAFLGSAFSAPSSPPFFADFFGLFVDFFASSSLTEVSFIFSVVAVMPLGVGVVVEVVEVAGVGFSVVGGLNEVRFGNLELKNSSLIRFCGSISNTLTCMISPSFGGGTLFIFDTCTNPD